VDTLIRRRDKTVAYYFARTNPLGSFTVEGGALRFRNLGEEAGLGRPAGYDVEWSRFDNISGGQAAIESLAGVPVPVRIPESTAAFLAARIRTRSANHPAWARPVTVYLRRGPNWEVVGIDRRP
jgi:hypothetical protein